MSGGQPIDIEVFVLTYNRSSLIGATIESLLAQKQPASRICVLDNGSTDETEKIVRSFAARGVELVRRNTNDPRACWSELQAMARGPWTMLFHDDDLLHPNYLFDVSAVLSKVANATVAVSAMRIHRDPEGAAWEQVRGSRAQIWTGRQLADRLYRGFAMPFCSAIYRTDVLRRTLPQFDIYGKIFDRPFVLEAVCAGKAVVMLDPYVKYRTHSQQDSTDHSTGPFLSEVLALQGYYRRILGERLSDSPGRAFLRRNYRNLTSEFNRLNRGREIPLEREAFFRCAIEAGAMSKKSLHFGRCYGALMAVPRRIERAIKKFLRLL